MASLTTVFRWDKLNKNEEAPIHFRLVKDRKNTHISTGIMLHKDFWDDDKGRIKNKHPHYARLTSFITNKFNELQDQLFAHETSTLSLTTLQLRDKIYGKRPEDFFTFADQVCEQYKSAGRVGTYDRTKSVIQKLREYAKGHTLSFQDITPGYLAKYENYLRTTLKNRTNTIHANLKFIRKIFNDAYRQDIIEMNINPFLKYKLKTEKTHRNFLVEEELKLVINAKITPGTRMDLHRDMFVFAAFTGGLRISDVLLLRWQDFNGSHLRIRIKKTQQPLSIKVPNIGLMILDKYAQFKTSDQGFIFPMLQDGLDMFDAVEVDRQISAASAYINKNLKSIAKKSGINKKISFHVSRHSWACNALIKNIPLTYVSQLMGHASTRETEVYLHVGTKELDAAMDAFN